MTTASPDLARRRTVLFDFDGTLCDTGPAIVRIVTEAARAHGATVPPPARLRGMIGPPLVDGFQEVFGVDEPTAAAWTADYRARFDREVTPADFPVMPGATEVLDALAAQGRVLAVATSRMQASAERLLEATGLLPRFAAVAGRDEVVRFSKADSIRYALELMGAAPADAVMVGDRRDDCLGAREVGIPCVGLYSGAAEPGEHEGAGAVAVCRSFAEVGRALGA